jgi:hypothetical protein
MAGWQRAVGFQEVARGIESEFGKALIDEMILLIDVDEG